MKKKVQLKTILKSQDSLDSSKDFGDQSQHHTSNETATHATVSTPHKYPGIFMFSFILIKARNVICNNKAKSDSN